MANVIPLTWFDQFWRLVLEAFKAEVERDWEARDEQDD
jgi:hypothetical protein